MACGGTAFVLMHVIEDAHALVVRDLPRARARKVWIRTAPCPRLAPLQPRLAPGGPVGAPAAEAAGPKVIFIDADHPTTPDHRRGAD